MVAEVRRREGGIRCHGFAEVPCELNHLVLEFTGVGGHVGHGKGGCVRYVFGPPFNRACAEGLKPNPSVVLNDIPHRRDHGADGWHVGRPEPPHLHHARAVIDDGVESVIAAGVGVFHPRHKRTFDLDHLVLVFKQVTDFDDFRLANVRVIIQGRHEENGQRKHHPKLLASGLGVVVGDSIHESLDDIRHSFVRT